MMDPKFDLRGFLIGVIIVAATAGICIGGGVVGLCWQFFK
jgi:hypothetical protein